MIILKDKYFLAFSRIEEIGSTFIQNLYNHFNYDIEQAFCASPAELYEIDKISKNKVQKFVEARNKINPDECYELVEKQGLKYITFEDKNYPKLLKEISNPPMLLYYKGDLNRVNFDRTLAIVGSRKASQSAKDVLASIINEFNGTDLTIVSGLAYGIDAVAHEYALKNNIATIGVIASGFNYTYPNQNRDLYKKIEDGGGLIFSEYWYDFAPMQFRFPHRNRIVSGLSYGTLVAEAALKSGALITANLTLEQNRELMCMPGSLTNPNTAGVYKLLKNGAGLVTSAKDILEYLNWDIIKEECKNSSMENLDITKDEEVVLNLIAIENASVDEIIQNTSLNFDDLMLILTTLEIKGYIKQVDGGKYQSLVKI